MARRIRDHRLDSRSARDCLVPNPEPYWARMSHGCYLGYRKGKRVGRWVARWRSRAGRQIHTTLGTADDTFDADGLTALSFDQAQAKAREWFQDIAARTKLGRPKGPYTVAQCMADYIAWLSDAKKSARHVEIYANAYILPELGHLDTEDLTTDCLEAWRAKIRRSKPRTRTVTGRAPAYRTEGPDQEEADRKARRRSNGYLVYLRAALNRAWKAGRIAKSRDVWMRVEAYKEVDRPRSNYLTEEHSCRLVNTCEPGLRELVQLALLTGARYGELCAFDVRDFDARNGTLYVRRSKNNRSRHIVL
ncbi:hypothetical protein GCM10009099_41780 [Caenispirillum bisanense]